MYDAVSSSMVNTPVSMKLVKHAYYGGGDAVHASRATEDTAIKINDPFFKSPNDTENKKSSSGDGVQMTTRRR
jgi:hypothetical protein